MKRIQKVLAILSLATIIATSIGLGDITRLTGVTQARHGIRIDGEVVNLPSNLLVMSKDYTTYVPLRFISENLGAEVIFEGGTITINKGKDTSKTSDSTKILDLQREVDRLKKENDALKGQLATLNNAIRYQSLPATTSSTSDSGLNIKVSNLTTKSNKVGLFVEIKKLKDKGYSSINILDTILTVDSKDYHTSSGDTDMILASILSNKDDNREGYVYFSGIDTTKIKGIVTFKLDDNGKTDYLSIYFDNTK